MPGDGGGCKVENSTVGGDSPSRRLRWSGNFGQCVKVDFARAEWSNMAKRRTFTAAFKARVAKEALRGDKTVRQIATKHRVHPNQVS